MPHLALCLVLLLAAPAFASDLELDFSCLDEAYPGFFAGHETDPDGTVWLRTRTGERLLYDDGKPKTHAEALANGDIEDSMRQPYPLEPLRPDLGTDEEAGRIRSYPLLRALYGNNRKTVERRLVRTPLYHTRLKVAPELVSPIREIHVALSQTPDAGLAPYFSTIYSQTWRLVSGTNTLSTHSFGIAVDLTPKLGPYWRWSKGDSHPAQKTYPSRIVQLFEDNGFVWGGKWRHFDLMHFEYRPEIILKARKRAATERQRPAQQQISSFHNAT